METLKKYYISEMTQVIIKDGRVVNYCNFGNVLTDYNGRDMVNKGEKYVILNGDVDPFSLNNFQIVPSEQKVRYVRKSERFDKYLLKRLEEFDLSFIKKVKYEDLTEEEIVEVFKELIPDYYKKEELTLKLD